MKDGGFRQVESNILDLVHEVENKAGKDGKGLTLEQMLILVNTERVRMLESKNKTELASLKERYGQVRILNDLRKKINNSLDSYGGLDIGKNPELKRLLEKAKDLGVPLDPSKNSYTKEERERLVENVRLSIDDLTVQNDLQMQTISRLQNEHHESFQMARSIMTPIQNAKNAAIRGIAGR